MKDIERDGRRFYAKDNGQAMVLFYLDSKTAAKLNRLSSNGLKPVLPGKLPSRSLLAVVSLFVLLGLIGAVFQACR